MNRYANIIFVILVVLIGLFSCEQAADESGDASTSSSSSVSSVNTSGSSSSDISPSSSSSSSSSSVNCITLDKVDLHLYIQGTLTGTVTLEIRDQIGSVPAIASSTIDASSVVHNQWNTFMFSPTDLVIGQKYTLYLKRAGENISVANNLFWDSNNPDVGSKNVYPYGAGNGNPNLDFMFRTYNNSVLDQYMTVNEYGYYVTDTVIRYQEFTPGAVMP